MHSEIHEHEARRPEGALIAKTQVFVSGCGYIRIFTVIGAGYELKADVFKYVKSLTDTLNYYKLKPEELTDDVFYALSQGLSNANHYEQRLIHWRDADSAIKGLEAQEFEKGRSTDTNYHQMMKEMQGISKVK